MPFDIQDGYAILDKDPQTGAPKITDELRGMFIPDWFREILSAKLGAGHVAEFEAAYIDQIAKQLKTISDDPQNWTDRGVPVGSVKMKLGTKSVPIKEVLLVSASYSIPIFIAISAVFTGPASALLAAKAVAAVAPATAKLYSAIQTYTPVQLDVHTAVVAAINRNYSKTLKSDGATLDEIEESFRQDNRLLRPRDLPKVLDDMKENKMLVVSVDGGVTAYKPNSF